jgi:nucleotide-binding universal stress UspA family protein
VDTESIGHVLCRKAQELCAVAIVMASHKRGRVRELLAGSVTGHCTHHSQVPVVVVR